MNNNSLSPELTPSTVLTRLRYALFAVFTFAFCLFVVEVLDRAGYLQPIPNASIRLVIYSIFLFSITQISSGFLKKTKFYYSIFSFLL
ncbi:hypothetical protein K8I31_17045, partial [bacterium]|nr:hypothetical protein [bacterium]